MREIIHPALVSIPSLGAGIKAKATVFKEGKRAQAAQGEARLWGMDVAGPAVTPGGSLSLSELLGKSLSRLSGLQSPSWVQGSVYSGPGPSSCIIHRWQPPSQLPLQSFPFSMQLHTLIPPLETPFPTFLNPAHPPQLSSIPSSDIPNPCTCRHAPHTRLD